MKSSFNISILILSIILFVFTSNFSISQNDTLIELKTIEINDTRHNHFSAGSKISRLDTNQLNSYKNTSLANLLNDHSSIFIKSYGLGLLATPSMRGGSSYHTAVIWNGFNLTSPVNGNIDFSLIKNIFIDNVEIQYGGNSSLWGSGAIGGAIILNNNRSREKGLNLSIGLSAGSFGNLQQNLAIDWSKNKYSTSFKLMNEKSENDFSYYRKKPDYPKEIEKTKQINNQIQQNGLLWENYFLFNSKNKLNIIGWYQNSNRNIAPTLSQKTDHANQRDESLRITAEWKLSLDKIIFQTRAASFIENLNYDDDYLKEKSVNKGKTYIAESEVKYYLSNRHLLNLGVTNTYVAALSNNYKSKVLQNQLAVFASYRFKSNNQKLESSLSIRKGILNHLEIPFTYTGGMNVTLLPWMISRMQLSKVYRLPTLNDLYWFPGGNPDLLPESGLTQELGLNIDFIKFLSNYIKSIESKKGKIKSNLDITYFNKNINDWIIWLPKTTIWSPYNIMQVWSRGLETNVDVNYKNKSFLIGINSKTTYVVSTNEKSKSQQDASLKRQLIYVPMYLTVSNLYVGYRNFYINYNHIYTGYRYTTTDNSEYLPPYHIGNFQFSKVLHKKNNTLRVFLNINNAFNKDYQVLLSRPSPLSNYQIGLTINLNQIKS